MVWQYYRRVANMQHNDNEDTYAALPRALSWAQTIDSDGTKLTLTCGVTLGQRYEDLGMLYDSAR